MTGLTGDVFFPWLFLWNSRERTQEPSMAIHPKAKQWVAVVEFIGFPIAVSVLLNMSAGPNSPSLLGKEKE